MPLSPITLKGEQKKVLFLPPINPIQIKGVAGSGKTTVALYRAKHLLETERNLFHETKIVIFTFNKTLTEYIRAISPLISGGYQKDSDDISSTTEPGLNVKIINFHSWAFHFLDLEYGMTLNQWEQIEIFDGIKREYTSDESNILDKSSEFFYEEISWIKGKLFSNQQEYLDAKRIGRGTSDRVTQIDKKVIWGVYKIYEEKLKEKGKIDFDDYAILTLKNIEDNNEFEPPFTHIIIDEAQDLNKAQITTISKLVSPETNSISIIADAAQRIFKSGFSWNEVGINVRGNRTIEFKTNYRNTIPVVKVAISLLSHESETEEFTEVKQARRGGEKPKVGYFDNLEKQYVALFKELERLEKSKAIASTVILHRTNLGVKVIEQRLLKEGYAVELVKSNNHVNYDNDDIKICTMSSIKGLEFDNVFILDLNENIIPYPPGFIEEEDNYHISTERRLLYTCITRTRNNLFLFCSGEPTRYLSEIDEELLDVIVKQNTLEFED